MTRFRILSALCLLCFLQSCSNSSTAPLAAVHPQAAEALKVAGRKTLPVEERAALYLDFIAKTHAEISADPRDEAARLAYNQAVTELTMLLHEHADRGMWNRPILLTTGNTTRRLVFAKRNPNGIWDPAYFTAFKPAEEVEAKTIKRTNHQDGFGGALVGIRKADPLESFSPLVGVTAPVTSIIDFKGNDALLTLVDPGEKPKFRIAGAERSVQADFSAPLAYYPQKSEIWEGLMGAIRVNSYMKTTGLYMLQPYDPDRIPLIFVHGLISTPRMWRNVINELEADPALRGRYQAWVFSYPTGNPPSYSALRFREELEKVAKLHPDARDYVLVGHSMGGLVSRMQAATLDREAWNAIGEEQATELFSKLKPGSLPHSAGVFEANPKIDRIIFICTPHRGSEMAVGSLGELGRRLISLPADLTGAVAGTLGNSLALVSGSPTRMPNSVTGLSPSNPMLKVLDKRPLTATHHSVIGDRGKGDSPDSSDGVVQYWSSSLKSAESELIVPGPHGACELPETLDELRRILHLHLKEKATSR